MTWDSLTMQLYLIRKIADCIISYLPSSYPLSFVGITTYRSDITSNNHLFYAHIIVYISVEPAPVFTWWSDNGREIVDELRKFNECSVIYTHGANSSQCTLSLIWFELPVDLLE